LDGIWLRGPYLHNGSVPTLRDLLKPVAERPKVFYRGYDVYDPENVGFVSQGPEAQRIGTRYDVGERASGNQGHEYGVKLSAAEKDALIEYLKSL
jgi:cytochrome c peroxidase